MSNPLFNFSEMQEDELIRLREEIDTTLANRAEQKAEAVLDIDGVVSRMRSFAQNHASQKAEAQRAEQEKSMALYNEILALKPRIQQLLETANACLASDIDVNSFVASSRTNGIAFSPLWYMTGDYRDKEFANLYYHDGQHHWVTLYTDGIGVFKDFRGEGTRSIPDNQTMEEFLGAFQAFENDFYRYVDKALAERGHFAGTTFAGVSLSEHEDGTQVVVKEAEVAQYLRGQGHPHPEEDGTLDEFMNGGNKQVMYDEAVKNNYDLPDVNRWFHLVDVLGVDMPFKTAMKIDGALYEEDIETMELLLPEDRKSLVCRLGDAVQKSKSFDCSIGKTMPDYVKD